MKTSKYISVLAVAVLLNACDFLKEEPHTLVPETYFNTATEVRNFVTGCYAPLATEQFYGNFYPLYIAGGDDLSFWQRNTPPTCMMCANTNSGDTYIYNLWRLLYQGINRCNMLIENVDNNTTVALAVRQQAKAEALMLRGFYYYTLVQGWGAVPMRLQSTKDVIGLDMPRTNKDTIYNQIIADMTAAIADLPDDAGTPELLSKNAARGILARVWMFRAGECFRDNLTPDVAMRNQCFTEARKWALEVKNSGLNDLVKPYSQIFIDQCTDRYNSTGVNEMIWEVPETGNNATDIPGGGRIGNTLGWGLSNQNVGITSHISEGGLANPGFAYNFAYASLKLYEMYEDEGDTARGDWNIIPYSYTTGTVNGEVSVTGRRFYYGKMRPTDVAPSGYTYTEENETASSNNKTRSCAKWRREYEKILPKNKNYTPINFPILRYADVLLMLAEAENELNGPTTLAYDCINDVRTRADISTLSGLTQDEFRTAIKKERAMELCFEAIRRFDLIRWGDFVNTMRDMEGYVYRTGWGASYQYAADYYRISATYNYFPIPDTEMSLNKSITTNNPGW